MEIEIGCKFLTPRTYDSQRCCQQCGGAAYSAISRSCTPNGSIFIQNTNGHQGTISSLLYNQQPRNIQAKACKCTGEALTTLSNAIHNQRLVRWNHHNAISQVLSELEVCLYGGSFQKLNPTIECMAKTVSVLLKDYVSLTFYLAMADAAKPPTGGNNNVIVSINMGILAPPNPNNVSLTSSMASCPPFARSSLEFLNDVMRDLFATQVEFQTPPNAFTTITTSGDNTKLKVSTSDEMVSTLKKLGRKCVRFGVMLTCTKPKYEKLGRDVH